MLQFYIFIWTACAFALCLVASCDREDRPTQPVSVVSREVQIVANTATSGALQARHRAYVTTDDIDTARQEIKHAGGRVDHIIPRDGVLIGLIPLNQGLQHSEIHEWTCPGLLDT